MGKELARILSSPRMSTYRHEWARTTNGNADSVSDSSLSSLYLWQLTVSSAWYENLALVEAALRHSVDTALRRWNAAISPSASEDWLKQPAPPLSGLVGSMSVEAARRADMAARRRDPRHPRYRAAVTLDDRVAQLGFGNLSHLFPATPPRNRQRFRSGFNDRENLWLHALAPAFPGVDTQLLRSWNQRVPRDIPIQVQPGYIVGSAVDQLRRLRNRISHQEQTFRVRHEARLQDVEHLLRAISPSAATELQHLDLVRRTLLFRPGS